MVGDAVSGAEFAPFLPALAGAHLPLRPHSLSPLFCGWARQCLRLEPFTGKFSLFPLFFFFFLPPLWLAQGLLAPSDCLRAFRTSPYPKSAAPASLFSPCLLVEEVSIWATFPLGVVVGPVICGFNLSIFSSQLCCPLRFQNSPQTRR